MWEETLIIFTSDNGGLKPQATDNSPIRQGKGGIYEGGVRVPLIIRLPDSGAKDALCHKPAITMDLVPTIFEAIGKPIPEAAAKVQDGVSLLPLLRNPTAEWTREDLFWHYPHYHSMGAQPYSAIRSGNWKLIEVIGQDRVELYDLSSDIHEDIDLVRQELPKAKALYEKLVAWRKSIGAQMPIRNSEYNPDKPTGVSRDGKKVRVAAPLRE
jgi:arylsulfatase A-like enzyme